MTTFETSLPAVGHVGRRHSFQDLLTAASTSAIRVTDALFDVLDRARQRRQLLALSEAALKDIGTSSADAEREAGK